LNVPDKKHRLVILGDSAFAEIAHEYFTHDSPYEVVAFSVEREYLKRSELRGLPLVALEDLVRVQAEDRPGVEGDAVEDRDLQRAPIQVLHTLGLGSVGGTLNSLKMFEIDNLTRRVSLMM
jgi:hypothetical protein